MRSVYEGKGIYVHLQGFSSRIPDLMPLILHDVQQAPQQLGQVTQQVHIRHTGQQGDPAQQEHALLHVMHSQELPQLGHKLIDVKVGAGRHNVLREGTGHLGVQAGR